MRVLLCHQPIDGGVGRHICDLAGGLAEAGHQVTLCSPAPPAGVAGEVAHVPLDLRRAASPRADLSALARLAAILRELRPQVVHAHSSKAGAVTRLARFADPRVPVLYSPHGYAFAGHFTRSGERAAYRWIERALAPLATRVVCVCEAEARLARAVGADGRVAVIYNGIAPAPQGPADPRLLELARRGPVIGALTLLRPGKGLETLIAAAPSLLERHPGAQLAIVGDGPDLDALSNQARALGVAGAVTFLGPSRDPLGVLRGMDVFVHPSWAESFPYVILEAMSLARPIVASDVGGIPEALVQGHSGLLTPARDERALARALAELLDDPARARSLGEEALRRSQLFSRAAMVQRMAELYGQVSSRASARGAQ
jgi:glycosyltransferase involved in cell wall biosynthesis